MNSTLQDPGCLIDGEHKRPELAVLFHLVDVSRPRQSLPVAPDQPPATDLLASAVHDLPATTNTPSLPLSATELSALLDPPTITPLIERPLPSPLLYRTEATLETTSSEAIDAQVETLSLDSNQPAEKSEPAAAPHLVMPASPIATGRKVRTNASEDWFAAHGKYIALAFVVALIATIHFARNNRRPKKSPPADAVNQLTIVDTKPDHSHAQAVAAVSDSQVELHPPSESQFAASLPSDAKSSANDRLFEFPSTKKPDDRVSARPTGAAIDAATTAEKSQPASAPTSPSPAPALAPGYPSNPQVVNSPTASTPPSGYPLTSAPPLVGTTIASPATPPSPATYAAAAQVPPPQSPPSQANQSADYRSQFPFPAGPYPPQAAPYQPQAQAWTPPAPGYGPTAPYQPTQTARGPRNERTGSGNY